MKIDLGTHIIESADDPHVERWMEHLHKRMSHEERAELFHEAKRDGMAHFSPKPGVHLTIHHNPDGTYRMEK